MDPKLQELTDGTYTLKETEVENQYLFFRNDHQVLGNTGSAYIYLFARYFNEKFSDGNEKKDVSYIGEMSFEISRDCKVLRITVSYREKKVQEATAKKEGKQKITANKSMAKRAAKLIRKLFKIG